MVAKAHRKPHLVDAALLEKAAGFIRRASREGVCKPKRGKSVALLACVYNLLATGAVTSYDDFAAGAAKRFPDPDPCEDEDS